MDEGDAAVVRVGFDEPIVLVRHIVAPDAQRAWAEVEEVRLLLQAGGRGILVFIDEPVPPPALGALTAYRDLIRTESNLEWVAIVTVGGGGFGATIAAGALSQLLRFTRLSGRMGSFTQLGSACAWLADKLEIVLDHELLAEQLDSLLMLEPSRRASTG